MSLLDMPLEALQNYRGTNPKPIDFDEYWDRALIEMNAVDSKTELIKSNFQSNIANCFDLYFTGTKGARVHAKLLMPKNIEKPCPVLHMFHGYTADSGDWMGKLTWVAAGFICVAIDVRGQGGKSEDSGGVKGNTLNGHLVRGLEDIPDNLFFRDVFLDTALLVKIVSGMKEADSERVCAIGGSMGGALTVACAALSNVKRLAPFFPFLSDYKRSWDMDLAPQEIYEYFRRFDPRHEKEDEVFNKLGYIDIQHLAPRIKGETLMAIGLMDNVCPPSTIYAVYNKISAPKKMLVYPDFKHEDLPGFSDMSYQFLTNI